MKRKLYKVTMKEEDVHDGDSIDNIQVLIYPLDTSIGHTKPDLMIELWPNIYLTNNGIEAIFNLRLEGIDAPEIHPFHIKDGIVRNQKSLDHEKALGQKAKQGLIDLLKEHNFECWLSDYQDGKYAGRIVANLFVKDNNEKLRSVSNYMITKGLARHYMGGHKDTWDNWN